MIYDPVLNKIKDEKITMTVEDFCNVFEKVKPRHWNSEWNSWGSLEVDLAQSVLNKSQSIEKDKME